MRIKTNYKFRIYSKTGIIMLNGNLVYAVEIPLLETDQFNIHHLVPIP